MPASLFMPLTPEANGFAGLLEESLRGGHQMLARFQEGWTGGTGRFARRGELMLGAFEEARLICTGGRSIDPYENDPAIGRVRHLYVAETRRGSGIGRRLIALLLRDAAEYYRQINVRAPEPAFGFYEHLGF